MGEEVIKKDQIFLVSRGSYSDYHVSSVVVAKQDIDPDALFESYKKEHPIPGDRYGSIDRFFAWLLLPDKGLVEEIKCLEWNLGEYGLEKPTISEV